MGSAHKKRTSHKHTNLYLIQARIQPVPFRACESQSHSPEADQDLTWEVRLYQNIDRAYDLQAQGVASERIDQLLWDEACREQDTIGVRIHGRNYLCSDCVGLAFQAHAGENALMLTMTTATVTGHAFLIASERSTEQALILSPFSRQITETDILRKIQQTPSIRLQSHGGQP